MGLGKSLTMLTAISRTRQGAQIFVEETLLELRKPNERLTASHVPSRASLVVVPTPCKSRLGSSLGLRADKSQCCWIIGKER